MAMIMARYRLEYGSLSDEVVVALLLIVTRSAHSMFSIVRYRIMRRVVKACDVAGVDPGGIPRVHDAAVDVSGTTCMS